MSTKRILRCQFNEDILLHNATTDEILDYLLRLNRFPHPDFLFKKPKKAGMLTRKISLFFQSIFKPATQIFED